MNRRHLLAGGAALAASAAASTGSSAAQQTAASGGREYYLIRRYKLSSGPQSAVTSKYFQDALLPALGRMGIGPVGVMGVTYGPETPTTYVIIPSTNLTQLTQLDLLLAKDETFTKAAAPFWGPAATAPPFDRVNSSLSVAFEGFPKLMVPAKGPRILQLRTYESPTYAAHVRKVEMFHGGEFDIFAKTGSTNVFFSDNLVGSRGPSPDLHAGPQGYGGVGGKLEGISGRPRMAEVVTRAKVRQRTNRLQHRQPDPDACTVFADLTLVWPLQGAIGSGLCLSKCRKAAP